MNYRKDRAGQEVMCAKIVSVSSRHMTWNIYLCILLTMVVPLASAVNLTTTDGTIVDFTFSPGTTIHADDINITYIYEPLEDNQTKGWMYIASTVVSAVAGVGGGGGSSGYSKTSTLYYDVLVDVIGNGFWPESTIPTRVTLLNKGREPDRDGVLVTWIESPNGTNYSEKRETFELIPPTCSIGTYISAEESCLYESMYFPANRTIINRQIKLPEDTALGQWKFKAEYKTYVQEPITSHDPFEVFKPDNSWFIIALIVLFYIVRRNKLI